MTVPLSCRWSRGKPLARAAENTRVLATFYFPLQFFGSKLLEFMEIWDFEISFAICQTENRSKYIHVEGRVVQGPDPSGPGYADSPPVLRHWQLVLKYFQY